MPGPLLHVGATVLCSHAGQAQPMSPNPRVLVNGLPTVTMASPYAVAGCSLPPSAGGPCLTAQWVRGASRVLSNGLPVLLLDSQAVCAPTGSPLLITFTQTRVIGM